MQQCATCPYYFERHAPAHAECRRYPPRVVAEGAGVPHRTEGVTEWPVVDDDDFCGEHPTNIAEAQMFIAVAMDGLASEGVPTDG